MALEKDVNSYVSLEEAEAYMGDRLDVAAWDEASDADKAKALVTATSMLDQLTYPGSAISDSQPLAFPRSGMYYDDKLGTYMGMDSQVARTRLDRATCELAYHLLNNDGLLDAGGSVVSLQVGSISLSQITDPPKVPLFVRKMLSGMLLSGGSHSTWWRNN